MAFQSNKWLILGIGSLLNIIFSCSPKNDYTHEIRQLDTAYLHLKYAEKEMLDIDTLILKKAYFFSKSKLNYISEKIANDTLNKKTALLISVAYEETKKIESLLDNKKFMRIAIADGSIRINNLKHDLQKDLIEKEKSLEYVKNEINSSNKINDLVHTTIQRATRATIKLDSLKQEILFLSDSLSFK